MLSINSASSPFQDPSASPTQASKKAEAAQSSEVHQTHPTQQMLQTKQAADVSQDRSEVNPHQESDFEPGGALRFSRQNSAEPSFTPLVSQTSSSREEIQQSADDNLTQLRNKRIEGRLSQLAEEQLRQIKDIRQP